MLTASQYSLLHTELSTDPDSLGYATLLTNGNEAGIATLLNNVGAGAAFSIFKNNIPVHDIISNIASSDYALLTQLQLAKLSMLFTGTAVLDASDTNTRNIVVGIFTGMTTTIANLTALAKHQGSRAEVLFGPGVVLNSSDIAIALRS